MMVLRCEICNCRISKKVLGSRLTAAGKAKNMGECDSCADEWSVKLKEMLKDTVIVTDEKIYMPYQSWDVKTNAND